jgi:predicted alpha/beta superfamily hydrolase
MKEYKVFIMESKELNREVRISVFLPNSYMNDDKFYPVLYMHDGQNLFDNNLASYKKSWGIMEAYETNPTLPELVIVGIDSTDTRSDELVPFKFYSEYDKRYSGGKSHNYYDFITKTLKPFIDKRYRTFKSAKNTGLIGSSYGGLSTTYAALKYSKYFSRFGCVSNAYFVVQDELENLIKNTSLLTCKKFYMDVGTKETGDKKEDKLYVKSNKSVYELLSEKIEPSNLKFEIVKDAIHNEAAWEIRFPEIVKFLFED